jgi:5-methyltetrahydropteroyltriglutamate--homocysteine methyltransferase
MAEGGYEPIADALFNTVNVSVYCLEYDTQRAGDFSPLRFVPQGKRVILGLVSTKTPVLETKDALRRQIDAASRHVPLERVGIGPQCGFSSGGGGGQPITHDDTRRKLNLIMEVSQEVWGSA